MRTALIGYTGFVGSNLHDPERFDVVYNSSNLDSIRGEQFDLVVSAAARADSHRINGEPDVDRTEIEQIAETIGAAHIERLVLISTVCIYPGDTSPDEDSPLSEEGLTPYGANRLHLERALSERFDTLAVRLPQLFGRNLKKGIVYDLLNDYRVEHIKPHSRFQYYDLSRLWDDIARALDAGLQTLNIATPAIRSDVVAHEVFGRDITGQLTDAPVVEDYTRDMRTTHADLFGGSGGYLLTQEESLEAIRFFVQRAQTGGEDAATQGEARHV